MPDTATKPVAVYVHRVGERRVASELKSAAAIAAFLALSVIILFVLWSLSHVLVRSISALPVWAEILLTIGTIVLSVVLAGMTFKMLRRKPTAADLQSSKEAMLTILGRSGKHLDVTYTCSVLVERWLWFNRFSATFGIDAQTRLADVRAVEHAFKITLPRVYVFSPEALTDSRKLDTADRGDTRPLFSERRFVRQYWLNGLWNFWALPLVLIGVTLRFSSLQLPLLVAISVVAPLFVLLIWWLNRLCRTDLTLCVRDHVVARADGGMTEPLDPRDCVVVVRRAMRPQAFQTYLHEVRWEFTRGTDLPLYFAEKFDPRGTAWTEVLDKGVT